MDQVSNRSRLAKNKGKKTYPSKAIENIDVITGVQIVNRTLAIDLEGVYKREVSVVLIPTATGTNAQVQKKSETSFRSASNSIIRILTFIHFYVYRAPPNIIPGGLFIDDTLVLGTSTRFLPGEVDKRSGGGNDGPLIFDSIFIQLRHGRVALHLDVVHVESRLGEILQVCVCT